MRSKATNLRSIEEQIRTVFIELRVPAAKLRQCDPVLCLQERASVSIDDRMPRVQYIRIFKAMKPAIKQPTMYSNRQWFQSGSGQEASHKSTW